MLALHSQPHLDSCKCQLSDQSREEEHIPSELANLPGTHSTKYNLIHEEGRQGSHLYSPDILLGIPELLVLHLPRR